MNLKTVKDSELIERTENLVREERATLTKVLHHLREIDRRRLFSSLGYKSLFDFTVKHLGYPEDQAHRRITAMRLLREMPEIDERINKGEISLTHIGLAQSLFKQEKKTQQKEMTHEEKLSVFEQIANKPVREAERITFGLSSAPELAKPDRVKALSAQHIEMKFTANIEVQEKVERLKGWLAHQNPDMSMGELFDKLCDLGLSEWNPAKTAAPLKRRAKSVKINKNELKSVPNAVTEPNTETVADARVIEQSVARPDRTPGSRSVVGTEIELEPSQKHTARVKFEAEVAANAAATPMAKSEAQFNATSNSMAMAQARVKSQAQIRREVFARANGQCENCHSTYALEIDHIQPQALGGPSTPDNLRLLCRSCNQRAAIKVFGIDKMDRYLN